MANHNKDKKRKPPPKPAPAGPAPSKKIKLEVGPDTLQAVGPLVAVKWSVPPVLAAALTKQGRTVPAPVMGMGLVDTGASTTCIGEDTAKQLGLTPIRTVVGLGAAGKHTANVYRAKIELAFKSESGQPDTLSSDMDTKGIPDLHIFGQAHGLAVNGREVPIVALLGRDLLRHLTLIYNGSKGAFELKVNMDSLKGS